MNNESEPLVPQPDNPSGVAKADDSVHPAESEIDEFWYRIRARLMKDAGLYRLVAAEYEALKARVRGLK